MYLGLGFINGLVIDGWETKEKRVSRRRQRQNGWHFGDVFKVGKKKKSVMGWGKSEEVGKSVSF